jgi:hypothetical protein
MCCPVLCAPAPLPYMRTFGSAWLALCSVHGVGTWVSGVRMCTRLCFTRFLWSFGMGYNARNFWTVLSGPTSKNQCTCILCSMRCRCNQARIREPTLATVGVTAVARWLLQARGNRQRRRC